MDLVQFKKVLVDYTKIKKRSVLVLGALGLTWYAAHRINNLPSVIKKKQRLLKTFEAFVSLAEMVSDSAEAVGVLSKDLKEFLQSESDEIPQSFKQASKITTSSEFSESLIKITKAFTAGILRGYRDDSGSSSRLSDQFMDKLFSEKGSGFAAVVVGSLARNLVVAFYSERKQSNRASEQSIPVWIEYDRFREIIGDWIRVFVSTAVTVYLDKTVSINTYDEVFSGLTNPKHEDRVREMLVYVCNGAVETYVRTSNAISNSNSTCSRIIDYEDGFGGNIRTRLISKAKKLVEKDKDNGWISKVSSTLAVPSNRKFVMDVTGKLTFETIRSFLEFLLEKFSEYVRRGVDVLHREVVDRGVEVMRNLSYGSSTALTVCFSLCLHVLNGPWILVPCQF